MRAGCQNSLSVLTTMWIKTIRKLLAYGTDSDLVSSEERGLIQNTTVIAARAADGKFANGTQNVNRLAERSTTRLVGKE